MIITETALAGVKVIEPDVFEDKRGFFFESYSSSKLMSEGITDVFVQDNHSLPRERNPARPPFPNESESAGKISALHAGNIIGCGG